MNRRLFLLSLPAAAVGLAVAGKAAGAGTAQSPIVYRGWTLRYRLEWISDEVQFHFERDNVSYSYMRLVEDWPKLPETVRKFYLDDAHHHAVQFFAQQSQYKPGDTWYQSADPMLHY